MTTPLAPQESTFTRRDDSREIAAPTGSELHCKSWLTEAPFRMLQNNLHPDVAENPKSLIVYGGIGRAARNWESYDQILESLKELEDNQSVFNPVWYTLSFSIGMLTGLAGDKWSLGFIEETERQVVSHLNSHFQYMPN